MRSGFASSAGCQEAYIAVLTDDLTISLRVRDVCAFNLTLTRVALALKITVTRYHTDYVIHVPIHRKKCF